MNDDSEKKISKIIEYAKENIFDLSNSMNELRQYVVYLLFQYYFLI